MRTNQRDTLVPVVVEASDERTTETSTEGRVAGVSMAAGSAPDRTAPDWLRPISGECTRAVLIDAADGEIAITDFMIRRACERFDSEHLSPFDCAKRYAAAPVKRCGNARRAG